MENGNNVDYAAESIIFKRERAGMKQMDEQKFHEDYYDEIFSVLEQEPYAQHLGMELEELGQGTAGAKMKIQKHMLNTHGTVHGAVIFALADYVFAVASNSYGKTSVGLTTTMNFMAPAKEGAELKAIASEEKRTHRLAWYTIKVTCNGELVATMDATVYRKNEYFIQVGKTEEEASLKK